MMIKECKSIGSIETYTHGTNKDLLCRKKEIKFKNIKNGTKMFNFDYITKEDKRL